MSVLDCLSLCKEQVSVCYDTCRGNCYRCEEIIDACESSCLETDKNSNQAGNTLLDKITKKKDEERKEKKKFFPLLFFFLFLFFLFLFLLKLKKDKRKRGK